MKPHPGIRKTVKWGGAAVTVLLVVVWIGSGWWMVQWESKDTSTLGVFAGGVKITIMTTRGLVLPPNVEGWHAHPMPRRWLWTIDSMRFGDYQLVFVPLWIPALISLALTAWAWRLDTIARRRARIGFCPKCNYDRTGLAAGAVCPECGSVPS